MKKISQPNINLKCIAHHQSVPASSAKRRNQAGKKYIDWRSFRQNSPKPLPSYPWSMVVQHPFFQLPGKKYASTKKSEKKQHERSRTPNRFRCKYFQHPRPAAAGPQSIEMKSWFPLFSYVRAWSVKFRVCLRWSKDDGVEVVVIKSTFIRFWNRSGKGDRGKYQQETDLWERTTKHDIWFHQSQS